MRITRLTTCENGPNRMTRACTPGAGPPLQDPGDSFVMSGQQGRIDSGYLVAAGTTVIGAIFGSMLWQAHPVVGGMAGGLTGLWVGANAIGQDGPI